MTVQLQPLSISRETVRQVALTVDRYQLMRKRFGREAADNHRGPRAAGVTTTRALERVEADHFLCDVHLVCHRTGVRLGRPWLTMVVDHHTGMALGYHLSFAPPSAAAVLAALRHTILPKSLTFQPEHWGPSEQPTPVRWLAYGIPDLLVVDNGMDLASAGVREACIALGIDLLFTPPRSPWYKGTVERFGRTINTRFIHWTPGTTLGQPVPGYDGADHAALTFDAFRDLLERYIVTIHNQTPRRRGAKAPARLFLDSCQLWPPRMPTSMADFDAAVALEFTYTLQQTGLEFLGLQYQNEALGVLWNRSPAGTRLSFKVNPLDLQTVQVRHPATGEYFAVDCVDEYDWPRSLSFHKAVRAHAKTLGLSQSERGALAQAQRDLLARIADAASQSRRALRRMQAELHRQGQADGLAEATGTGASGATAMPADDLVGDIFDEVYGED